MLKKITLLSLFLQTTLVLFAQKSDDIIGTWLNQEEDAQIEVFQEQDKYFGKIVWLKNAKNQNGDWILDTKNPLEELRNRKKLGLTIMHNLTWDEDQKEWNEGQIYDAREGDTYSLFAKTDGTETLNLRGYVGFSLFGKTTTWKRATLKKIN
tara:strand:+ start:145 stop:600 length:456 start_codon:yes stop_codon:yes gene_type:complete